MSSQTKGPNSLSWVCIVNRMYCSLLCRTWVDILYMSSQVYGLSPYQLPPSLACTTLGQAKLKTSYGCFEHMNHFLCVDLVSSLHISRQSTMTCVAWFLKHCAYATHTFMSCWTCHFFLILERCGTGTPWFLFRKYHFCHQRLYKIETSPPNFHFCSHLLSFPQFLSRFSASSFLCSWALCFPLILIGLKLR